MTAAESHFPDIETGTAPWIDVTVPIRRDMVHYPGNPCVELRHVEQLERGDPATVSHLSLGVHTGTHVDAPAHFIEGAAGVEALPLDFMNGPARIVELHGVETITADELRPLEIAAGERLLLRTDNSTRCWTTDEFVEDYAYLTPSAARYLAERKVRMVGIDYLSVGRGSDGPETHRILLHAGVVILEGLDLSGVPAGRYDVTCMPLNIAGSDGAPARVAVRAQADAGPPESQRRPATKSVGVMRALVVNTREKSVGMLNREGPRTPTGSEVLLRTLEVGICGTDREICAFHYGQPPEGSDELILGHEALAEVVDAGPDAVWAQPGDLVVPIVRRPCSIKSCAPCRQGRQDFCVTGKATERGIMGANGFLADYFVAQERFLVSVPHALRDVAVLIEPLSVVAKGAEAAAAIRTRLGFVTARDRMLVLGAGPVGILSAMAAVAADMTTYVFSREEEGTPRTALLKSIGAKYVSAAATPLERLGEVVDDVDIIAEAVGVPWVAWGALPLLGPNGVYVMSGVPAPGEPAPAELARWMRDIVLQNQVIVGTVNAGRSAFESAVHRLEQFMGLFPDAVRGLIRRHPIDEVQAVLERGRGLKDVITLAT